MNLISLTIARTTFLEGVRQPVFFVVVFLCGIAMIITTAMTGFSMGYSDSSEVSGDNKLLLDLSQATIFMLSTILAGFIATSAISREIENKTVLTVVSKPVARWKLVVGKWLGVTGAVLVAGITMGAFVLLAIRHGVLSNASDDLDLPVWVFGMGAFLLSLGIGVWGSFFYGWSFPQVAVLSMAPLMCGAYVLVLFISKKWEFQGILIDFKPQVFLSILVVLLAIPVLTSVAVAASTRLGQVMTIVICIGVFVLGLLSNGLIGSKAIINEPIGQVLKASAVLPRHEAMRNPGDEWKVELKSAASPTPASGQVVWYATSPNGIDKPVRFANPGKLIADPTGDEVNRPGQPSALVVTEVKDRVVTLRTIGGSALAIDRVIGPEDYLFTTPTKMNYAALGAWGMIPSVQFFWLVDAVSQNSKVPLSHVGLILMYVACQVVMFLSIAILLFEKRDVG